MDKRKAWREQEQLLVARWNAATTAYQAVQAEITLAGGEGTSAELATRVSSARAEMEAVRKQVARLKVEFTSGKRY